MHGLAAALWHAMLLGHYEGNPAEVERLASELIELCTRQHFAQWLTGRQTCRGWAHSAAGDSAGGFLVDQDAVPGIRGHGLDDVPAVWAGAKG